jgi:hypothetical protein
MTALDVEAEAAARAGTAPAQLALLEEGRRLVAAFRALAGADPSVAGLVLDALPRTPPGRPPGGPGG